MMAQAINLSTGVDFYEFEAIPFKVQCSKTIQGHKVRLHLKINNT